MLKERNNMGANEKLHKTLKKNHDKKIASVIFLICESTQFGQLFRLSSADNLNFLRCPFRVDLKSCQYCLRIAHDANNIM
jgi:hypothetical protein